MSKIIFDTSFLVGLIDKKDKFHNICVTIYDLLEERKFKGIIFDCVTDETISVLARRAFEQKRMDEFIDIFNTALNFIKKEKISWICYSKSFACYLLKRSLKLKLYETTFN